MSNSSAGWKRHVRCKSRARPIASKPGPRLALDAGTGLRQMGNNLLREGRPSPVHLLLSHTHWDHVLGLPFFGPLWGKDNHIFVYPLAIGQRRT